MKAHFLFLTILVLVGCESQSSKKIPVTKLDLLDTGSESQLTKAAAIKVADDAAKVAGYNLSDYRDRTASLAGLNRKTDVYLGGRMGSLAEPDQPRWLVKYEPKVLLWATNAFDIAYVTNRFEIDVDGRTRVASSPLIAIPN